MFKNEVDTYLRMSDYTHIKKVGHPLRHWLPSPLAIWAFVLNGSLVTYCSCYIGRLHRGNMHTDKPGNTSYSKTQEDMEQQQQHQNDNKDSTLQKLGCVSADLRM